MSFNERWGRKETDGKCQKNNRTVVTPTSLEAATATCQSINQLLVLVLTTLDDVWGAGWKAAQVPFSPIHPFAELFLGYTETPTIYGDALE